MSSYKKAIEILTSQGKFHINLGLERIEKILELLGNPQDKINFIHIAGTNGKGSTSAILSSILTNSGIKTGLFTSPHVFEYTERIKINDVDIEKEVFAKEIIKIVNLAEKNDIPLTEFEIITAAAFEHFAKNKVEAVVLETGLGGRLDATNVIKTNLCSIITHIDFDHTERLGDTLEKIAAEKAGIIKPECPVVASVDNKGLETIKAVAEKQNSPQYFVQTPQDLPEFALMGLWQKENLAVSLMAVEVLKEKGLKITEDGIELGLKKVKHPCRFEYLKEKNLLIDGAHNPDGAKALRESLDHYFKNQGFNFVFGCLNNKNYPQMMKNLFTEKDSIYFYNFDNPNSCSVEELGEELGKNCDFDSKQFENFETLNNKLTVICGSFYMIKELLRLMHKS